MDTEPTAQVELGQRLARPRHTHRNQEVGEVDIALHQTARELRTIGAFCRLAFTKRQVLGEGLLQTQTLPFQRPVGDDEQHYHHDGDDAKGTAPVEGVTDDVADEEDTDGETQQLQGDERSVVDSAVAPQRLEGVAVVLFHHQRPQERSQNGEGDNRHHYVLPKLWKESVDDGLHEV